MQNLHFRYLYLLGIIICVFIISVVQAQTAPPEENSELEMQEMQAGIHAIEAGQQELLERLREFPDTENRAKLEMELVHLEAQKISLLPKLARSTMPKLPPENSLEVNIHWRRGRIGAIENELRYLGEMLSIIQDKELRHQIEEMRQELEERKRFVQEKVAHLTEMIESERPLTQEVQPREEPTWSVVYYLKEHPTVLAAVITGIALVLAALVGLLRRK